MLLATGMTAAAAVSAAASAATAAPPTDIRSSWFVGAAPVAVKQEFVGAAPVAVKQEFVAWIANVARR